MAVATDVSSIVERAAADCDMERDCGVYGCGFLLSRPEVAFLLRVASHAPRFGESIIMSSAALAKATHPRQPMIALLSYENARHFL